MVTMVPGQGEQFSQCVPSNNIKTEGKKEQENKSEELNPLPCSLSLSLFSCVYVFVCLCFGLMVNRNRWKWTKIVKIAWITSKYCSIRIT